MSQSCPRCGASATPDARFCAACGAPLEPAAAAERKLATLVFADLVGSTTLVTERDPEDARRMLEPFFALARTTLEGHGGRVEKFIGDAVVAVFGVPRAHGDDPDRAIAAAIELVERLHDAGPELEVRIGIEAGEVLVSARDGDLAITGEPAHAAARLQTAAQPGEILVGARAAMACRGATLEGPRPMGAKGFGEPLQAWRVAGRGGAPAAGTPFLGRGGELDALRLAYLRTVREREPRLVLVQGEAGVGKTRLVRELLAELARSDPAPLVLVGRNPPYGRGIAFWALAEILRDAANADPDADPERVREALAQRLAALGASHSDATARTLADSLSAAGTAVDAAALTRAWRRLLGVLGGERPLVVAVEDTHWADEGFLELLEQSVTLPGCPLLVVCTARPEIESQRPSLAVRDGRDRLTLEPLSPVAAEELAAHLVQRPDPELAREIAAASAGNPFFAEEIAHAFTEGSASDDSPLPDTVQAAIAARLDALPPAEKRVLQLASVLGERFSGAALRELLGASPDRALAELERRRLVAPRPDEADRWRFHHQLIREVGYTSLTRAERIELHERAAGYLHARTDGRTAELGELIAFHLARAGELDGGPERTAAAFDAVSDASAIALKRGAPARAQELLEQAAHFAADDAAAARALGAAAEIAMGRMRGDEALRLLDEKATLAERAGESNQAARALAVAVEVAARMSGISGRRTEAEVERMLERARELADPGDDGLRAQLLLDEAWIMWRYDRPERMAATAAKAVELTRTVDDQELLSSALDAAAAAAWVQGRYEDAVSHSRERVELLDSAEAAGYMAFERSDAFSMLTDSLVRAGALREAARWVERNVAELADSAPHVVGVLGLQVLYMLGEWDDALERSTGVRAAWVEAGRPPLTFFAPAIACVAAIHGIRGERSAEREWFEFALLIGEDNPFQVPGARMWAADAALHRGDLEQALELLEPPGIEHGAQTSSGWQELILAKRAEVLALAGDSEAEAVLTRARARPGDAHAQAVAARAQGLLEGDDRLLAEAADRLAASEQIPELARTQWLRGGEHRRQAGRLFECLGAPPPA